MGLPYGTAKYTSICCGKIFHCLDQYLLGKLPVTYLGYAKNQQITNGVESSVKVVPDTKENIFATKIEQFIKQRPCPSRPNRNNHLPQHY